MFFFSLLIGLALAGGAVSLTLRAAALPRLDAVARLQRIRAYGFIEPPSEVRSLRAVIESWTERLGRAVIRRFPRLDEDAMRRELISAGIFELNPYTFVGYRTLAAIAIPAFVTWLAIAGGSGGAFVVFALVLGAATGWIVPSSLVHRRAAARLDVIERTLPELIDLLVVTIEAGLGFSSAMQTAAGRIEGPLGDELKLTLQENNLGLSIQEALANMLERSQTPSMRSFVRSVLQGETLGVSIGAIMRNLAIEMRKRRRAMAEERAQKAPIKMMFPLIFLIFPCMFIVLLYPAVYSFMQAFTSAT